MCKAHIGDVYKETTFLSIEMKTRKKSKARREVVGLRVYVAQWQTTWLARVRPRVQVPAGLKRRVEGQCCSNCPHAVSYPKLSDEEQRVSLYLVDFIAWDIFKHHLSDSAFHGWLRSSVSPTWWLGCSERWILQHVLCLGFCGSEVELSWAAHRATFTLFLWRESTDLFPELASLTAGICPQRVQ